MRPRGSAQELERRRFRAIELIKQGEPRALVARILGVSQGSLSRWCMQSLLGTVEAKPHQGHPSRLSDHDFHQLKELLAMGATAHGWSNNLWTTRRVAQVIREHFGVEYDHGHISRILKKKLKWTCQRPEHQHKDRDNGAIKVWMDRAFPRILAAATARNARIAFLDEAGFMLEPIIRRTYAPRGETPIHRVANPHSRISVIGAITISLSRRSIKMLYGLLDNNLNYRGPTLVHFLRLLRSKFPGPMTVIWDRIPIHDCKDIDDYLAEVQDVVMEPLPQYAPELNPADGIWRYVKFGRLANYTPQNLDVLRERIIAELDRLKRRPNLLRSFVRYTKLPIDP